MTYELIPFVRYLVQYSTIFLGMLIKRKMTDCGDEYCDVVLIRGNVPQRVYYIVFSVEYIRFPEYFKEGKK